MSDVSSFYKNFSIDESKRMVGHLDSARILKHGAEYYLSIQGWIFAKDNIVEQVWLGLNPKELFVADLYHRPDVFNGCGHNPYAITCGLNAIGKISKISLKQTPSLFLRIHLKNEKKPLNIKLEKLKLEGHRPSSETTVANRTFDSFDQSKVNLKKLLLAEYNSFMDSKDSFQIPTFKKPELSIVVLSYNQPNLLYKCLRSIISETKLPYEIIIIDNASDDLTQRFLDRIIGAKITRNIKNLHFVLGSNQGAALASCEILLFLNSDCFVYRQAIDNAHHALKSNSKIGIVGAKIQHPNGLMYESGLLVSKHSGRTMLYGHSHNFETTYIPEFFNVDLVSGTFLMTRKDLFKKLKGFSTKYAPGYYEDVDYCLRAKSLGFEVVINGKAAALHIGNASSSDLNDIHRTLGKNAVQFVKDHGAPSSKARTFGFNVSGHIFSEKGVGQSIRKNATLLKELNYPVAVNPITDAGSENRNPSGAFDLHLNNPYSINLVHIHPPGMFQLPALFGSDYLKDRYNIAYWVWEQEQLPESWIPYFDYFDEIWTPSTYCQDIFRQYTKKPVIKIPHYIARPDHEFHPIEELNGINFKNKFVFLFIYDSHSSSNRKNLSGLIEAFQDAFGNNPNVLLLIKSSRMMNEKLFSKGSCVFKASKNVILLNKVLSDRQLNFLYSIAKAYVSLHRSEGFGLTIAEAMSRGIVTIATGYSGNTDFMTSKNSILVNFKKTALQTDDSFYKKWAIWSEPDLAHAAQIFKDVFTNYNKYTPLRSQAKTSIEKILGPAAVKSTMEKRIQEIKLLL